MESLFQREILVGNGGLLTNGSRNERKKEGNELHLGCVYEEECLLGLYHLCPQKTHSTSSSSYSPSSPLPEESKRKENSGNGQEEGDEYLPPPKCTAIQYSSYLESNLYSDFHSGKSDLHFPLSNGKTDLGEGNRKRISPSEDSFSISTLLEAPQLGSNSVHKFWGMVKLDSSIFTSPSSSSSSSSCQSSFSECSLNEKQDQPTIGMDFIVVIDRSSSMKMDNKLAFVQATIEYLIGQLGENHRFGLITFNQEVDVMTEGLLPMNSSHKSHVSSLLKQIKAEGSTNISDALLTAITLLQSRESSSNQRLSSILLFTDGLANIGLRGCKFLRQMKDMKLPVGLSINTFGYGLDHDSQMLQNISMSSKGGVYYYIETVDCIPSTFGECLAGLLSTLAHNIRIQLIAEDGCRIVSFYTKYPVSELKNVKDYKVSIGSLYRQESKSILFKLSIRKTEEISRQNILQAIVSWTDSITGIEHQSLKTVCVSRPSRPRLFPIPTELDRHINRYAAAAAIEEAVHKASEKDYQGAKKQIEDVISSIQSSLSSKDPNCSLYCQDLITDLMECLTGLKDENVFHCGVHYAHAYATMYYMERSTGTRNLVGIQNIFAKGQIVPNRSVQGQEAVDAALGMDDFSPQQDRFWMSPSQKNKRSVGYGYLTSAQVEESFRAQSVARSFVTGYMENVF